MSKLRFSYGTMNSGKSLQLLTTVFNFEHLGIKCMTMKPILDTRDVDVIKSRVSNDISKRCTIIQENSDIFKMVSDNKDKPKWIFVDEAQFLTEQQVDQLGDIVDKFNIEVWCFGIRTDFQTKLFPGSKRLFEIADKIESINSSCSCGGKNTINVRIDKDGNIIKYGEQVEIGAEDKYISMCRKCYKKLL